MDIQMNSCGAEFIKPRSLPWYPSTIDQSANEVVDYNIRLIVRPSVTHSYAVCKLDDSHSRFIRGCAKSELGSEMFQTLLNYLKTIFQQCVQVHSGSFLKTTFSIGTIDSSNSTNIYLRDIMLPISSKTGC